MEQYCKPVAVKTWNIVTLKMAREYFSWQKN